MNSINILNKVDPPRFKIADVNTFVENHYNLSISQFINIGSYFDQNFQVTDADGKKYIVKISEANERLDVLECQNKMMDMANTSINEIEFPECVISNSGTGIVEIDSSENKTYYLRILNYIEGIFLKDIPNPTTKLLEEIGEFVGRMDKVFDSFSHPGAFRIDSPWDLKNAALYSGLTELIPCNEDRRVCQYFIMKYKNEVQGQLSQTPMSIIHGDVHRYNLLLKKSVTGDNNLKGLIDFGDACLTYTIFNLAVTLSDLMVNADDPLQVAEKIVRGYHRVSPLNELELELLIPLACTRLSIYLAMAAYQKSSHPKNDHSSLKELEIRSLIHKLIQISPVKFERRLKKICGYNPRDETTYRTQNNQIAQRNDYLPKSCYTLYGTPVYLLSGALQYLFDREGNTYLDCVNNVSQWGHTHPLIVDAIQKQVAQLNTNSRFIYNQLGEYAEKLVSSLPLQLDTVFFVNSGSEANDLAIRLARTFTGNFDVVVIDQAYHGNSTLCTDISPHRIDFEGGPGLPDFVHKIALPDQYRGSYKYTDDNAGLKYGMEVSSIIESISNQEKAAACFIAESLIGTGGQYVLPENYLKTVYKHIRKAGGLCIADEVQVGFARTGDNFWCFESQGVIPDIITMGKPIGNGHPMAAVVTSKEIADALYNSVSYFNTFGGNPVSCAAGLAVLNALEQEDIQINCKNMSSIFFDQLSQLQQKHEMIGDLRGLGLYIGVDLVTDRELKTPATDACGKIVEDMKKRGILINRNGESNNIIKIKPPLIINRSNIEYFIEQFDAVLDKTTISTSYSKTTRVNA